MQTITKSVYYCDFCKKKSLVKGVLEKHELNCSGNPIKDIPNGEYTRCVDIWLKEVHIGWDFNKVQGAALKSIMTKLTNRLKSISETSISDNFRLLCQNLPDWYQDKELNKIDSAFNEIIQQIKDKKNGKINPVNSQPISKYF